MRTCDVTGRGHAPSLDDPLDVEAGRADVYPVEHAAVAAAHRVQEQQQRVEQIVPTLKQHTHRRGHDGSDAGHPPPPPAAAGGSAGEGPDGL